MGRRPLGRPPALTRAAIVDAAVDVGFQSLTLVAVAERLGVTHAGLYGHVVDRDDLVLAAAERVAESLAWPPGSDDWRASLEAEAWTLWRTFTAHPGMLAAVAATGRTPDNVRRRFAGVCAHLADLGFPPEAAVLAADTVYDLAADASTRSAELVDLGDGKRRDLAAEWSEGLPPALRDVMAGAITGEPNAWFAKKLDVVLAGIRATLAPRDGATPGPGRRPRPAAGSAQGQKA